MQALSQIIIALAAAALLVFAATRNIVVSGIAGAVSLVLYDIGMSMLKGSLNAYLGILPLYVIFYTAYIVLSVSFTRFSPKIEEKPRLPGAAIAIFSILVLACAFYGTFYLASLPHDIKLLYSYIIAFLSAVLIVTFLARDIAKIGLSLLASVWYCHAAVPEANVVYMSVLCVVSMFVVGTVVYYAYKEYNSRNIDLMIKLRL